jgi:serine/threonine protein kinase
MDDRYEAFCMASPLFYDVLHRTSGDNRENGSGTVAGSTGAFRAADRPLPDGWHRHESDDWIVHNLDLAALPAQGWKIHAAATPDNADRVITAVWDYCVPRGISFKFLRSPAALVARLSKYAPRGYSGKLVTIYPADDAACETILHELGAILEGEPSPYILSDLRWGAGPLYVRYGAFTSRYCVTDGGQVVPAIADGSGVLVPDRRGPVFYVPPWVTLPDFLAPQLAARNAVTMADLPYTIERVLHFSNGGGIYVATDTRTGQKVVLKEGRPYCGLDARGDDAVRRVEREHDILQRLAGIPGIPAVHDLFWVGEHRFLAMEHIEGLPLSRAIVRRYPLTDITAQPADFARFTAWALTVYDKVEATINAIHERGLVYGDMHLFNVMVRAEETDGDGDGEGAGAERPEREPEIALLDFEVAAPIDQGTRPGLGNQGFSAPRGTTGADVDRYGLACLRLALFLPMTNPLWLSRPKARHYAEIIAEHFPAPADYLAKAVNVIVPKDAPDEPSPTLSPDPAHWPRMRAELTRAILASATPDRDDRLFPGDIQQFSLGGLGLAYGAAGVLYALSATGAGRHPQLEEWLLRRATKPPSGTSPGLYDGLHGVAYTLDHLGHRQQALDVLDICLAEDWKSLGLDLRGGLSGIGLNLLHLADRTGEPALRVTARLVGDMVAERLGEEDSVPEVSGRDNPYAGLLRGSAGAALFLLRMYDETGDSAFLDKAAVALRQDLRRSVVRDTGVLEVNEGWRTMPYLEVGSVGIGMVLDEYLARRHDEQFAEASHGCELAAQSTMYILPGLFTGRAGILLYLAGRSAAPAADPLVARQIRGLSWHALRYGGGLAFPGMALLRLSMDLATGTAGVLLALGAALHDRPVHAPLLLPTRAAAATPATEPTDVDAQPIAAPTP